MPRALTDLGVAALGKLVESKLGLHFPPDRRSDLVRGAEEAARELGFECLASFTEWLTCCAPSQEQLEILSSHLTVGETYFFREKNAFDALQFELLPGFIRSPRKGKPGLSFWSAACCSGEEAYSIAMLLDTCLPEVEELDVSILATDINPRFLEKARKGIYSSWSFRALPDRYREKYFTKVGKNSFQIAPRIQQMVEFRVFNLAGDEYERLLGCPSSMDMIFCRNAMIYFQPELSRQVLSRLHGCLVPGGWLAVSPCEIPLVPASLFAAVEARGATLFRKEEPQQQHRSRATLADSIAPVEREAQAPLSLPAGGAPDSMGRSVTPSADHPPPQRMTEAEPPEGSNPEIDPFARAEALFARGLFAEAASILEESCADGLSGAQRLRGEPCELMLLVRSYGNLGRFSEALDWCAKAASANNVNPDFHYLHAVILLEVGREEEAAEALRRVLYLDLDHALAHFSLGNLCRRQQRREESSKHYRNALDVLRAVSPDDVLRASEGITAGTLSAMIAEMLE